MEEIQMMVNLVSNFLSIAFPFALVFSLADKFVNLILSLLLGGNRVKI